MTNGRKLDKKVLVPGLALLTLLVIGADAPLLAQERAQPRAQSTRSSGGGSSSAPKTMSRSSNSSTSSRATSPSRGATARSGSSHKASNTRQSKPSSRHKGGRSGGHYYPRHYNNLGLYFGYGNYYGGFYGSHYYYPYYYSPFHWGVPYYVPRRAYREYRLGAFDLNVKPKKSEVYLDGQFIGTAGQFDGFPDHLWLEEGSYELIFYRPGLATERRVLSIYPGVVVDVRLRLAPGESVAPDQLTRVDKSQDAAAEVRAAYESQAREAGVAPPASPPVSAELDTRAAPGRLRLNVLPADASVYLDGRLLGSGDELERLHAGLVVEAGSHMIEVVRPGYASERLEFAVEGGDEVELEVLLEAG